MLRDIGITCARRDLSQRQAVLEGVTQMQTTSMHTPARRGGALVRTVRAVGRWFSRSVNALGQRTRTPTPTGGSTGRGSRRSELVLLMERGSREIRVDCYTIVLEFFLINTWEGAVLRAEKNGTPLEEFEEIVFEKLLTSSPNPRRNER
jgi:hypothetical protein